MVQRYHPSHSRPGQPGRLSNWLVGERAIHVGAAIYVRHGFENWGDQIEAGLGKMRDRGELAKTADPEELAIAILGAVQGGLLLAKTMRAVRPVELTLDMALALVERHLAR